MDDLSVVMPPHARLRAMEFLDGGDLRVSFQDGGDQVVGADRIAGLYGAQVRSEMVPHAADPSIAGGLYWKGFLGRSKPPAQTDAIEGVSFVFALRVTGVGELWYALADSFNFRAALGSSAGYATEANLRGLMRRLSAIAPKATRDDFVMALIGNVALPPPVDSVFEFFKTAGKDL
jgi:hypothetical protein